MGSSPDPPGATDVVGGHIVGSVGCNGVFGAVGLGSVFVFVLLLAVSLVLADPVLGSYGITGVVTISVLVTFAGIVCFVGIISVVVFPFGSVLVTVAFPGMVIVPVGITCVDVFVIAIGVVIGPMLVPVGLGTVELPVPGFVLFVSLTCL